MKENRRILNSRPQCH